MNSVYTIISGGPPFGTAPTHQADGRIFFLRAPFISIACMRYRRGRPDQGVPLRAEGFPKRRCQLESVAAERRI